MKKKKKILTKKQKIIITCIAAFVFIIILGVALSPTKKKAKQVDTKTVQENLNKDLTTVQEVVAYLESTYISMEDSKVEDYDTDIYVSFKYPLYQGEESKETYFTNFYEKIARVMKFKSFRIIDNGKKITIAVKCSKNTINEVLINGQKDYFKNEDSRKSKDNELKVETLKLDINSNELQSLINAKWDLSRVNLGTHESTYDKYKIYFDEGYEIREIQ